MTIFGDGENKFVHRLKSVVPIVLSPWGRKAFLQALPANPVILDIGCGNDSPRRTKQARPDCRYIGLDVGDYHQSPGSAEMADEYLITTPDRWPELILRFRGQVDAVVSNHNLEHCNDPELVVHAMAAALKPGGMSYYAFPSEWSTRFPHRRGTLNFYDDPTHKTLPAVDHVTLQLCDEGVEPIHVSPRYRPLGLAMIGLLQEPFSWSSGTAMKGTWALWGFESVIWGRKRK